jgi:hypothetical protein
MITAEKLKLLTNFPADMLTLGIQKSGYKKDSFRTAKFVGITNGGEFCYRTTYLEEGEERITNVFVRYNPAEDRVSVDY